MNRMPTAWDYLILTASNDVQASAYESQLRLRFEMGHLPRVRQTLVVADLEGKRIGSGGSTVECLRAVVARESQPGECAESVLRRLRILIVHAGGDSRRLPAYGPCGKIFLPVPGESGSALGATLFDRLTPVFMALPAGAPGAGQVVVTAGDALIHIDASAIQLDHAGVTGVGSYATPEEASRHGVFCAGESGAVRLYLQKPGIEEQAGIGAINRYGKSILDAGVMSFDGASAAALLKALPSSDEFLERGVDLYREVCCALGTEASVDHFVRSARGSGSAWSEEQLAELYPKLRAIPFHVQALPQCSFLHFGSTRQLVESGLVLAAQDRGIAPGVTCLSINNDVRGGGSIAGAEAWVEGCRITAPLTMAGRNVVVGADVSEPLSLQRGACLDVLKGHSRNGAPVWFIRCYAIDDDFKKPAMKGSRFCGMPLLDWVAAAGCTADEIWDSAVPECERSLWNARVFVSEPSQAYSQWLWMYDPSSATAEQKRSFRTAERYSVEEMAVRADQGTFHRRRAALRACEVRSSLNHLFRPESMFTARDLAFAMAHSGEREAIASELLAQADAAMENSACGTLENLAPCRVLHSLGSAVQMLSNDDNAADWSARLRARAFRHMNDAIIGSTLEWGARPRNALRPDETIWGRGPARIELGGGWTDTPPYTLEHGGDVINVAVNLNGQPPIHCYCRIVEEPVVRVSSIDGGRLVEIRELAELLDYRKPGDFFALAKAALAISGFSPEAADWPLGITLEQMLREFGGGIELTTLVGIPKGSGLGTSSILGAVILAVVQRMMGRPLDQRALFHDVLRLEQALTTGGGWQDQVGGGVGGAKITSTRPGIIPNPLVHYVPADVIDPKANGGSTLLYYTGLTRLAKNILEQIVGGYLDRDRAIMAALEEEHLVAHAIADAMSRRDAPAFGQYVNVAWELQKRLCGTVTNETIERLLAQVRPYVHGMRISGAGSGGFLLMICKSPRDAAEVRRMLEAEPLNERSRFFDYEINHAGLEVTTC